MQSLQAASASPRWGAETAITTDDSPIPTRPTRWAMATAQRSYVRSRSAARSLHDLLGHALVGLVLEVEHRPAAGLDARRADEDRGAARLLVRDLRDDRRYVERLLAEPERPAGDGRDQRHLVAVGELPVGRGVLAVHGVEQARRLVAELERCPDVRQPDRRRRGRAPTSPRARAGRRRDARGLAPRRK